MKKFERLLKGHKSLVFLDFEGTQFSHEMIAIGAVHVVIDRNGYIKRSKKPFKVYVKAHNRVGKIVTDLTGITDEMLKQKGVSSVMPVKSVTILPTLLCALTYALNGFLCFLI